MQIEILYPEISNLYGDSANAMYLKKTLKNATFIETKLNQKPKFLDNKIDLVYIGSCSEKDQEIAISKLLKYKDQIKSKIDIKSVICFIIAFTVVMLMAFITPDTMNKSLDIINIKTLIILFLIGVLGAASMVLPGISGSFVLMLIGYYEPIMNSISEFTKLNNLTHNILILAMFGLGVLFGIIFMAKLIKILLEKYEIPMYMGIIGFVIASAISILVSVIGSSYGVLQIIIGVILMFVGIIASRMISKGEK